MHRVAMPYAEVPIDEELSVSAQVFPNSLTLDDVIVQIA